MAVHHSDHFAIAPTREPGIETSSHRSEAGRVAICESSEMKYALRSDETSNILKSLPEHNRPGIASTLILAAALTAPWTGARWNNVGLCDAFLLLAIFALVFERLSSRREIVLFSWYLAPFAAALFILVVDVATNRSSLPVSLSSLLTESGGGTFAFRLAIATAVVAIAISSETWTFGRRSAWRILKVWAVGCIVGGAAALSDRWGLTDFSLLVTQATGERSSGLAFHPNSLAFSLSLSIPIAALLCKTAQSRAEKVMWAIGLAVAAVGLYQADSRAGLIVGYGSLAAVLALTIWQSRVRWTLLPLGLLSIPMYITYLAPLLATTRLVGDAGTAQSNQGRMDFAANAFQSFASSPILGAGLENASGVAVPLVIMSAGGLALLLPYYFFYIRATVAIVRQPDNPYRAYFLIYVSCLLLFGILNNGFSERFMFWPLLVAFSLYAAPRPAQPN
jgi:hypothetical protein